MTIDDWTGDSSSAIAFRPDGKRAYAIFILTNDGGSYSALAVIDTDPTSATYNTQLATINRPDGQSGWGLVWRDVALSPDGSTAYVTRSDGKLITVINTATNTIVDTFITDTSGDPDGYAYRYVTVASDGTLYVTDPSDGRLYVVTVDKSSTGVL